MRVNVLYDRWPHHAKHSGYPRVAQALARHVDVRRLSPSHPRLIPNRPLQLMAARAGKPAYEPRAAERELVAAARLSVGLREICHFFYAERDFRFAAALTPFRRGAIVCTYHEAREQFDWTVPDKAHMGGADAVVALSEHQAQMLRDTVPDELVHVVPLGIDTTYYRPASDAKRRCAIFVGEHGRDFDVLVEVAERCRETDPELCLDAITTRERAAELSRLPNVRARSGVSDEELVRSYRSARLMLLPLRSATANNALLEGMSCGLPVIATDVGGTREYVDGKCGALVAPGDSREMATAVLELMRNRPRLEQMGVASRRRALHFDWDRVARRQLEVYGIALGARRRAGDQPSRGAPGACCL